MIHWTQKNLHTSRQYNCHDLYNISLWSVPYIPNQNTGNFWEISLKGDGRYVIILLWNDCMPHFVLSVIVKAPLVDANYRQHRSQFVGKRSSSRHVAVSSHNSATIMIYYIMGNNNNTGCFSEMFIILVWYKSLSLCDRTVRVVSFNQQTYSENWLKYTGSIGYYKRVRLTPDSDLKSHQLIWPTRM